MADVTDHSAVADAAEMVLLVRDLGAGGFVRLASMARAAGCRIGVVNGPNRDPGVAELLSSADRLVTVADPTNVDEVTEAARQATDGYRLGAVLSTSDGTVAVAAQVAERLGLRRTPAAPIMVTRDKFRARQVLAEAGLAQPGFALLSDAGQVEQVAAQVGLPAVVKPVNGTGSYLVRVVRSVPELAAAYQELAAAQASGPLAHLYTSESSTVPATTVLVEGALQGREFCMDVVVRDGQIEPLALIDKFLIDERFFELGFVDPPFDLPEERAERIRAHVVDAIRALGIDNTVAHVEIIDDVTLGPTVVEVNAGRPGGVPPMVLTQLTTGVDTAAELLAVHRGVPSPRTAPKLTMPVAALNIFPTATGRVRAVHGLDKVAEHPDVISVDAGLAPGQVVTDEYESHMIGIMVAGFLDRDDLIETYHQLASMVTLEIEPI